MKKNPASENSTVVHESLQWLWSVGVREICLCPGGRNAPFVVALENKTPFKIHLGFDERATGFYALGLAQNGQRPVAVIVTSGTAVAELLPAVMEAHYTRTPLVVISADRPSRMRGTGAPQTVEQVGIFTSYVERCVDMEGEFVAPPWQQQTTLHLNICFDEPLVGLSDSPDRPVSLSDSPYRPVSGSDSLDRPFVLGDIANTTVGNNFELEGRARFQEDLENSHAVEAAWMRFCKNSKKALVFVSTLTSSEVPAVRQWLERWPGWVYAECTSGLREIKHAGLICSGEKRVQQMLASGEVDSVIRIGGVPTARAWRNLEKSETPVFSLSRRPFSGLSRGEFFCVSLENILPKLGLPHFDETVLTAARAKDMFYSQHRQELLTRYPQSEPAMVQALSRQILADTSRGAVYIGNSLPIREWDSFAERNQPVFVQANRGANGIDGQLSSALGFLQPQRTLWVVLGDLTTLYDANALWFWQKNSQPLKLVVINNQGGKIFERLFNKNIFYNEHRIHFSEWAKMWGLPADDCIELQPSDEQTKNFWSDHDQLWEKKL